MNLFLLLSLQAAATPAPPPAASPRVSPVDFDLARVRPANGAQDVEAFMTCGHSQGSEIVVCGRKPGVYPLDKMAKIYERGPLRAEVGIGGGAVAETYVQQVELGSGSGGSAHNGLKSKRIMVGIKVPF